MSTPKPSSDLTKTKSNPQENVKKTDQAASSKAENGMIFLLKHNFIKNLV
jgi:hypothetical protein